MTMYANFPVIIFNLVNLSGFQCEPHYIHTMAGGRILCP